MRLDHKEMGGSGEETLILNAAMAAAEQELQA